MENISNLCKHANIYCVKNDSDTAQLCYAATDRSDFPMSISDTDLDQEIWRIRTKAKIVFLSWMSYY